jgi:glycosyltransferase involved in cell wall biosynthesis
VRKNVPGALEFVAGLQQRLPGRRVRYWLTGPPEDGYDTVLDGLLAGAAVPVTLGRVPDVADAYAAADLVLFPSTWEGFGNPLVEAAIARRPVVAGRYPVRAELEALGLRFLPLDALADAAAWVARPDEEWLDANVEAVRGHLDLGSLPARLDHVLHRLGNHEHAATPS